MRIVVATTQGGLDDQVAPTFGRTPTFTLVDVEGSEIRNVEVLPNQFAGAPGGAGPQAAQWAANSGAQAVIAGNFGPNASSALAQAGIELFTAQGMTVREAVERYIRGELAPFSPGAAATPGFGPGMGMGRGGGMSMSRGMGAGRGMGMGQGGGRGRGMGRGGGMGVIPPQAPLAYGPGPGTLPPPPGAPLSKEEELRLLRDQARSLEEGLEQIKRRLEELQKGGRDA
jgi:predicted Fe-Mo cluster-binding NifX family protein